MATVDHRPQGKPKMPVLRRHQTWRVRGPGMVVLRGGGLPACGQGRGFRVFPITRILSGIPRFGVGLAVAALAAGCGTEPPVPSTITISPASATLLRLDETVQLTATVRDADGGTLSDVKVDWTTWDERVATVDATGLVTAVGMGEVPVLARAERLEASSTVTVDPQRGALLRIYDAMGGPGWDYSWNWGTDEPIDTWWGVTTDTAGIVVALDLSSNELTGTIPAEIAGLENLQVLRLSSNELTGPIPPEIGNLTELTDLHLYDNELTGPIPPELGKLMHLRYLSLVWNELTGPIPAELGGLPDLFYLLLAFNRLSGPVPPELGKLTGLWLLRLDYNDLTGSIPPELGNLQSAAALSVAGNDLTGPIPPELGKLRELGLLYLYENALTGPIPPELGNLASLGFLDLGSNDLSGPIPPELGNIRGRLIHLALEYNDLSGPVPRELGRLVRLGHLALDNNNLSGRLPRELTALRGLSRFYWHETDLCSPPDEEFQEWLASIRGRRGGGTCES